MCDQKAPHTAWYMDEVGVRRVVFVALQELWLTKTRHNEAGYGTHTGTSTTCSLKRVTHAAQLSVSTHPSEDAGRSTHACWETGPPAKACAPKMASTRSRQQGALTKSPPEPQPHTLHHWGSLLP